MMNCASIPQTMSRDQFFLKLLHADLGQSNKERNTAQTFWRFFALPGWLNAQFLHGLCSALCSLWLAGFFGVFFLPLQTCVSISWICWFPPALDFCVALSLPGVAPAPSSQDARPDDFTWTFFPTYPCVVFNATDNHKPYRVAFKFHVHYCLIFLSPRVPMLWTQERHLVSFLYISDISKNMEQSMNRHLPFGKWINDNLLCACEGLTQEVSFLRWW